ncbi:MAG: tryptophan synthase alpha chain [Melioribacteraceae bacterium]|nr:MAG: tryptophan synthase alpha chain [Melioribacteraceae bacterium]
MSFLKKLIKRTNDDNRKVLSVFVTAGFPTLESTISVCSAIYDAGADIIELGIPFSDPLADGPVIQTASQTALENGVTMEYIFKTSQSLKKNYPEKGLVLMGYSNPVMKYGLEKFLIQCKNSGVNGVILPDIPVEEFSDFYNGMIPEIDKILLTTPVSSEERIKTIDEIGSGFVYCVSILGTTGTRDDFEEDTLKNLERTRRIIKNNHMLIGFGISNAKSVQKFTPYCDGIIVGSAVIKAIADDYSNKTEWDRTIELISELSEARRVYN